MRSGAPRYVIAGCTLTLALGACGAQPAPGATPEGAAAETPVAAAAEPKAEARPEAAASPNAAVPADDESRPPSERIIGKWKMDVNKVPDTALTKDFLKWKTEGKADQLRIEYTITDSQFNLDTWAPNGRSHKEFHYEILKEIDNSLVLKRIDEKGSPQEIPAVFKDGMLIIGTGNGQVPLVRIE